MKLDETEGYSSYYLGIRAEFETRVMYNFCVYAIYTYNTVYLELKKSKVPLILYYKWLVLVHVVSWDN